MIEGLIATLGAEAGVGLPDVRVTGADPVLPSAFRIGTAAAASVGAATAAVAAFRRGHSGATGGSRGWEHGSTSTPPDVPSTKEEAEGSSDVMPEVRVDVRHAAVAFRSERYFRIDGSSPDLWAPLSGDYRSTDGWIRLHCNFDHHRDAALRALGLPSDAGKEDVVRACVSRTRLEIEEAVTAEGGCAAAMRTRAEWRAHPQGRAVAAAPLVGLARLAAPDVDSGSPRAALDDHAAFGGGSTAPAARDPGERDGRDGTVGAHRKRGPVTPAGPPRAHGPAQRPLSGVRVLDLTRVIAGPVAGRFLAAHGAEVLRVGAAHLPEVPGLVVETAFGKRSCHIDLRTEPGALRRLIRQADIVIQSYRPGALRAMGFGPEDLAKLRPGIVAVDVSAYGSRGPWAGRRGFDSLVQMACGIAHAGGDGKTPHPLPCQALDHATGYLAAFGAVAALLRRSEEGGSWHVEVSLARTAQWLDDLGGIDGADTPEPSTDGLLATMGSRFGTLTYVTPPGMIDGAAPCYASAPPGQAQHPSAWL